MGECWVNLLVATYPCFHLFSRLNANFEAFLTILCTFNDTQKTKITTHNPEVVGSNPSPATNQVTGIVDSGHFFGVFA